MCRARIFLLSNLVKIVSPNLEKISFKAYSIDSLGEPLSRFNLNTLQVNLGKRCNMACLHCHVEAGPNRTEEMSTEHVDQILELLTLMPQLHTVDITGGAPELHPQFRRLVKGVQTLKRRVIDRCNISILLEPGQEDLAQFLAEHEVEVVASLPCYLEANVEQQRGKGSFSKSIEGLLLLNSLNYGHPKSKLKLDLVYNPIGPSLPPSQIELQEAYQRELKARYGIIFNRLLTITNMPIKRFAHQLEREGQLETYQDILIQNYNGKTLKSVMCRELISVSWDGKLYDCDFNQMLNLELGAAPKTLSQLLELARERRLMVLEKAPINTAQHCFACTAGAGSSCGGALN